MTQEADSRTQQWTVDSGGTVPGSGHTNPPEKPGRIPYSTSYGCSGCDTRWGGVSRCHCSACHQTFAGLDLFDRHRRDDRYGNGHCLDPETIVHRKTKARLAFNTNGIWQSAETPTTRTPPKRTSP